jgi:aspartate oxidase
VEGGVADLIRQADTHYQAAQDCLQAGDWTCYGREMDALEQVLEALVDVTEE